jgi:hypothetical protein
LDIKICANPECGNEFEPYPVNKKFCSITCKRRTDTLRRTDLFGAYADEDEEIGESSSVFLSDDLVDVNEKVNFLRKENTRLANLLDKHKHSSDEIWTHVLSTVKEHAKQIVVKPPKEMISRSLKRSELVFNPWNSDTQLGKRTPSYNSDIAVNRVEQYTDKIIQHAQDFKSIYPVRKAHVYFLGDIVEGEGIFPTQPHTIDSSLYEQVAKNGPAIYAAQLRRLLEVFEIVHVTCVIGNHGRLTKFNNPETNMDRMLYKILEHIFAYEPRISFDIPDGFGESMFWAVDKIGDYSTLLIHGDQFPSPASTSQYWKKILGWKTSGIPVSFDDVAMGHWHQNTKFTIGTTVVRIAGSTESSNTFAQERIGVMGNASQHLQIIDPTAGVFWESDVFLD